MTGKLKPWMLLYFFVVLLLAMVAIKDDVRNQYYPAYICLGCFSYLTLMASVIMHAVSFQSDHVQRVWRWLFPFQVVYFIPTFIVDALYGKHANLSNSGASAFLFAFVLSSLLFLPAFWSSFLLAYKRMD